MLIFSPKSCLQKNIILILLLSLKSSEPFLLSSQPGLNCGNDKLLSRKYTISEPEEAERSIKKIPENLC